MTKAQELRRVPEARVLHEALSPATLVGLAVHALALLGDGYFKPSLADITIPLATIRPHAGLQDSVPRGGPLRATANS